MQIVCSNVLVSGSEGALTWQDCPGCWTYCYGNWGPGKRGRSHEALKTRCLDMTCRGKGG